MPTSVFDLNIKSIKEFKMINPLTIATELRNLISEQVPGFKTIHIATNPVHCKLVCLFDNHTVTLDLMSKKYQVSVRQKYAKLDERGSTVADIQQNINLDYPDVSDIPTAILKELSDIALPYGNGRLITIKPIVM